MAIILAEVAIMKRSFVAIFIVVLVIILCVTTLAHQYVDTSKYLRIHIRANSNSDIDQDVKYRIKGEVVKLLSPKLRGVKDADTAKEIVLKNIDNINNVANKVLEDGGYNYRASTILHKEKFPTRYYGNMTLEEGVYDALIVNLGRAEGNNWWCVVFPPLCFVRSEEVGSGKFTYVSKIKELLQGGKHE